MKYIFLIGTICSSFLFSSCFEEDERISPQIPGEEIQVSLESSIYENQIYFDLGSEAVKAIHPNDSWVLAFGSEKEDWQVKINSGAYYAVHATGKFDFDEVIPVTAADKYHFDATSGNPDSCSFAHWLNRDKSPWEPTGEIFLIGKFDGIKYSPMWRIRIDSVNDSSFQVSFGKMNGEIKSAVVRKDPKRSLVHVNPDPEFEQVEIEPPKTDWDILFSQYGTILFTDEGEPTPYFVRGTLQNPYKHRIALDTLVSFDSLNFFKAIDHFYSAKLDAIGHDWKEPVINFENNTAIYQVRKDSTWIINDNEGYYFKFRFVSYYNKTGEKGYPGFEYLKL